VHLVRICAVRIEKDYFCFCFPVWARDHSFLDPDVHGIDRTIITYASLVAGSVLIGLLLCLFSSLSRLQFVLARVEKKTIDDASSISSDQHLRDLEALPSRDDDLHIHGEEIQPNNAHQRTGPEF